MFKVGDIVRLIRRDASVPFWRDGERNNRPDYDDLKISRLEPRDGRYLCVFEGNYMFGVMSDNLELMGGGPW